MSLRRSAGLIYTPDDFPPLAKFPQTNLATWHEVIRRISTILSENGKQFGAKAACELVAQEIEAIWISHTVYAIKKRHVATRLFKKYGHYLQIRSSFTAGKPSVKCILSKKEADRSVSEKVKAEKSSSSSSSIGLLKKGQWARCYSITRKRSFLCKIHPDLDKILLFTHTIFRVNR